MAARPAADGKARAAHAGDAVLRAAAHYRLTAAEAALLREILDGRSLAESARRLARSRNTARNQLQAVFAKTGTHRQAELIVKVLKSHE